MNTFKDKPPSAVFLPSGFAATNSANRRLLTLDFCFRMIQLKADNNEFLMEVLGEGERGG